MAAEYYNHLPSHFIEFSASIYSLLNPVEHARTTRFVNFTRGFD
jgi:hypothetical protein